MSGLCAHNSPSSSFVNCSGLASYESNRAKLAASKPASANQTPVRPISGSLALLESWIFLLLVDGVLISETTKRTKLHEGIPFAVSLLFRRVFVVKFGRYPPLLSVACS